MIDHYDVIVPAFIESGVPFEVRVVAIDAGGNIVDDDSTSVTLTSSSSDILFDSNGNETFGEVGDNIDTLLNGIVEMLSLDTKGTSFTLSVEDLATQTITGSDIVSYNFNCIVFLSESGYQTELSTKEHPQFQRKNAANNTGNLQEEGLPQSRTLDPTGLLITANI